MAGFDSPPRYEGYPKYDPKQKETKMTKNLASTKESVRAFIRNKKANEAKFLESPTLLAAEIARQIRLDEQANKEPYDIRDGNSHWYQGDWATVKLDVPDRFEVLGEKSQYGKSKIAVQCATTGCVAGWATNLVGYPMLLTTLFEFASKDENGIKEWFNYEGVEESVLTSHVCWNPKTKEELDISDTARRLLDLDLDQSAWLFDADRTKEEVLWGLDEIAAGNPLDVYDAPEYCDCGCGSEDHYDSEEV